MKAMLEQPSTSRMISIPRARVQIGLTPDEAEGLARELGKMEEQLHEPGLGGFDAFDLGAAMAKRREWLVAAMPAHEVEIGPFEIAAYPVTYAEYARYVREAGTKAPDPISDVNPHAFVTGISWREALAYCQHIGCDLPSEAV